MNIDFDKQRKFIQIDGSNLAYLDIGVGPVVILGHSYLWSAEMWEPQIIALSKHYRVIVPELWGHGKSGILPDTTFNLQQIARQNFELLEYLNIKKFAIAGLSVGGMWAIELALLVPERVSGLILLGTFVGSEPSLTQQRYFSMLDAVKLTGSVPDAIIHAMIPMFFSSKTPMHHPNLIKNFHESLRSIKTPNLLESIIPLGRMIFTRRNALPDLQKLSIPSIVITGTEDQSRPPIEGKLMAEHLNCQFIELKDTGHISSLESPNEITELMLSFFAKIF
ncbi:alpha/beta fold hydrolase [Acinetobacter lactucae]|uniref:alpha/beta fold hydrolase n=1 Tax=Acinetobacter lactucae TaxID=1785128 RepID=UPI00358DC192